MPARLDRPVDAGANGRFPFDSLWFANAHVWRWPECIGLFGLGRAAYAAFMFQGLPLIVAALLAVLAEVPRKPGPMAEPLS